MRQRSIICIWTALLLALSVSAAAGESEYTIVREPDVDENGVVSYFLTSPYLEGENRVRLLFPKAKTNKILFALPVAPWPGFEDKWEIHGDGLSEILKNDYHNRYGYIVVAPDFPDNMPWFVNHVSDTKRRHETYMMKAVLPFVDSVVKIKRPLRDLIGFSKSGYGSVRLLLSYPEKFNTCSVWDPGGLNKPYEPEIINSLSSAAGSAQHFQALQLAPLIRDRAYAFRDRPRLAISGYSSENFRERLDTLHQLLVDAAIPHRYSDQVRVPHHWYTGWLGQAMASLDEMSRP